MLAPRGGSPKAGHAVAANVLGQPRHIGSIRRPMIRQQQRMQATVGFVDRQGLRKILKIAVQVNILMGHPAQVGKPMGIERMHIQKSQAIRPALRPQGGIPQRVNLHAVAAEALHTMAGARHNQQPIGLGSAIEHQVRGERLAVAARQRVRVRLHRQAGAGSSG